MKKLLFVLMLIFAFVFTGCGGETPEVPDEPIVNEYKITFEENGGSKVEDYLLEEGKTLTLPEITKEGYTFKGWYKDNEYLTEVEENISISSDLTLYAKWEELILETEGLIYKLNSDGRTYYVSDYVGDSTIVYIPNYYNDRMVTGIGDFAFSACSSLSSITIPNSVTSIGNSAFSNCTKLTSITIPNSVTSIGNEAFIGCSSLTSITIPNSVKSIGSGTFFACSSLTSITLPFIGQNSDASGKTHFGYIFGASSYSYNAFYIPSSFKEVILTSCKKINDYAFNGCSSLTSITIPNSVTSIGDRAFYGCSSLTSITIPNSVTSIGNSAFSNCTKLTSITIPNSVTSIGNEAFIGCSSLTSITIPNSVKSIGDSAFRGCSSLTSITIPNSVKSIGDSAFFNCTKLTSITISNSVTSIGDRAFCNCAKLTSITIPNSVISIGISAFSGCFALTSITIPNSVTSIGDYAFSYSSKLTIYCEMASKPIGWSSEWNLSIRQVIWNCEFINIIFMNDDVKILEDINFAKGYTTSLPVIAKQNYIFLGWYKDKELTTKWDDENDIVTENMILYAKWALDVIQ